MRLLLFIFISLANYAFGQLIAQAETVNSDSLKKRSSSITIHLELSGRIGGGTTSPQWTTAGRDAENQSVTLRGGKTGTFNDLACQITVAGAKRFSLIFEPGYALSNQSIDYCYKSSGQAASTSSCGSFDIDMRKTEAALLARMTIVKKWGLYLIGGGYGAREDSRILNGSWTRGFSSNVGYNPSGSTTEVFNKKHGLAKDQLGLIAGLGVNLPLKHDRSIFFDLRMNVHSLKSGFDPAVVRMMDLGLFVGYTFYKSRSIKVDQIPANDY
jgi:hypothetical protein